MVIIITFLKTFCQYFQRNFKIAFIEFVALLCLHLQNATRTIRNRANVNCTCNKLRHPTVKSENKQLISFGSHQMFINWDYLSPLIICGLRMFDERIAFSSFIVYMSFQGACLIANETLRVCRENWGILMLNVLSNDIMDR